MAGLTLSGVLLLAMGTHDGHGGPVCPRTMSATVLNEGCRRDSGIVAWRVQKGSRHPVALNPHLGCRLNLRGGSALAWAAIENADSESDRERLEQGDETGAYLHDVDMDEMLRDCSGATTWDKFQNYVKGLQSHYGEEEVDNIDIDEFGCVVQWI